MSGVSLKRQKKKDKQQKEDATAAKYNAYVAKKINTYITRLTTEQHNNLMNEFDMYMKGQNNTLLHWYRKFSLGHPAIIGRFNNYIKEMKKEHLGVLLTMDELIELIE